MANEHYKRLLAGLIGFLLVGMGLAQEQQSPQQNVPAPADAQQQNAPQIRLGLGSLKPASKPEGQSAASPSTAATPVPTGTRLLNYRVQVVGKQQWTDTNIDLHPGDKVELAGTGQLSLIGHNCSPDGLARGWADL